jgi:DNA-binding NarL/FixJ family response regulator
MKTIRVVIADDHPLFRRGVVEAISRAEEINVVGEASNGDEARRSIETLEPDVVVMDIEMPGEPPLVIARRLRDAGARVRLLFLTMHRDEAVFHEAIDAGAAGYVLKDAAAAEIVAAVRAAAAGTPYISPTLSSHLLTRVRRASALADAKPELQRLTVTERKILKSICLGRTSKEVAHECGISFRTVENHRANICAKLGLSGTNALLRFALEHKSEL